MTLEYLGVGISFRTIVFMDTRKKNTVKKAFSLLNKNCPDVEFFQY